FDGPARPALVDFDALRISFGEPAGYEVRVLELNGPKPVAQMHTRSEAPKGAKAERAGALEVAVDQIVEVAIPFACLEVSVDQPIQFWIELLQGGQSRDRAPREGTINLTCPSPDFEQIMWDV